MTGLRLSPVDRLLAERPYFRGNLKSIFTHRDLSHFDLCRVPGAVGPGHRNLCCGVPART